MNGDLETVNSMETNSSIFDDNPTKTKKLGIIYRSIQLIFE